MTESEVEGASLPTDGIDVDETSAYFGVTQTSDLIIRLNETDRLNGLGEFLTCLLYTSPSPRDRG